MKLADILDIGLGVANIAINANNASKLDELRMQGAAFALSQALTKELRNQIFNYKKTAEAILASESKEKVAAAAAMKVLETSLTESGITPELFQELMDKEYAANTISIIRENSNRMYSQLLEDGRAVVIRISSIANRLKKFNFYVENYQRANELKNAIETISVYEERNSKLILVGIGLYIFPGITIPFSLIINSASTLIAISAVAASALWIWGLISILKWRNSRGYKEAKRIIEQHGNDINLDTFNSLQKEFGNNLETVKKRQDEARKILDNFFGNTEALPNP